MASQNQPYFWPLLHVQRVGGVISTLTRTAGGSPSVTHGLFCGRPWGKTDQKTMWAFPTWSRSDACHFCLGVNDQRRLGSLASPGAGTSKAGLCYAGGGAVSTPPREGIGQGPSAPSGVNVFSQQPLPTVFANFCILFQANR